MAAARKCDECGKFYLGYPDRFGHELPNGEKTELTLAVKSGDGRHLDKCYGCASRIILALVNKLTEENIKLNGG